MICSNCGNDFEGKFCPECGTKAEVPLTACPECCAERLGQSAFCANCGFSFKAKPQSPSPTAIAENAPQAVNAVITSQNVMSATQVSNSNIVESDLQMANAQVQNSSGVEGTTPQGQAVQKQPRQKIDFAELLAKVKMFFINIKAPFAKIYRYFIAGSMIFAGIIALLCLTAPAQIESMLGLTNKLGSGFKALGGDGSGAVITASVFLLLTSLASLGYGGFQIYLAMKKPYFTVKNYFFWGVDAIICFMFFLCGCIVAGDCGSNELMKVSLGSGFGFSIAMGVFGFLFLAGRIFYELKVFDIADTKVSAEEYATICKNKSVLKMLKNHATKQKIKNASKHNKKQHNINNENISNENNLVTNEKNKRKKTIVNKTSDKKMSKKKITLICVPIVVMCLVAIIVPAVLISNNIFRVGKVDKINIGDTKNQVINILGVPYTGYYNDNNVFEYFSDNYVELKSKLDKLTTTAQYSNAKPILSFDDEVDDDFDFGDLDFGDLEDDLNEFDKTFNEIEKIKNQLNNLVYKYIKVEFDVNGKVQAITLDKSKSHNINNVSLKTANSLKLANKDIIAFTEVVPVIKTKYSDGSFYKCTGEKIMFSNPLEYNKKTKEYEVVDEGKQDRGFKFTDSWGNEIDKKIYDIKVKKNSEIQTIYRYKDSENRLSEIVFEENVQEEEYRRNNFDVVFLRGYDDNVTMRKYNEIYYDVSLEKQYKDLITIFADLNIVNITSEYEKYDVQNKCVIKKDEKKLVLCLDMESDLVIPNNVSIIGEKAFYNCILLSVLLPNSVTRIEERAFSSCELFSVTIPKSVIAISDYAFSNNLGLTIYSEAKSITGTEYLNCPIVYDCNNNNIANDGYFYTIVNGVRYAIKNDSAIMASQRTYLSGEVIVPQNIIYKDRLYNIVGISSKAFNKYNDESIVYCEYNNALYLGNEQNPYQLLVKAKSNDITSCEINSNTKGICSFAFYNCDNLTSITIPNNVVWIGENLFGFNATNINYLGDIESWCQIDGIDSFVSRKVIVDGVALKDLTELVIPNGTTRISDYAFYDCSNLTSIIIPDSVTSIGRDAFFNCKSLTSITIPDSVTSIGDYAFYNCKSLTSVTIPDSVTNIGRDAFFNCANINVINYLGDMVSWCQMDRLSYLNCEKIVVGGVVLKDLTELVIPNGVSKINGYAFYNCKSLTSVTIPDSVTSIGMNAFYNYANINVINYLGDMVSWCQMDRLSSLNCEKIVVGGVALNDLTELVIPNGVSKISGYAFYNCKSLTSVTIPDNVTSIGRDAFAGCNSLTSIIIPNSVQYIGGYAFAGCNSLINVEIGNGVAFMGDNLFDSCVNLKIIRYNGTIAQWRYIERPAEPEPSLIPIKYEIHCIDGVINIEYQ